MIEVKKDADVAQEKSAPRVLGRVLARELTAEELDTVSGGTPLTDDGKVCDSDDVRPA